MKNMKPLVPIICVLVGLGVGFGGGYFFRNYQASRVRGNFGGTNGNFQRFTGSARPSGAPNGAPRGGAVSGSIVSMDDKSITVKMNDGSTKIVLFADSTTYSNTVSAAKSDLKIGDSVAIFGTANSDGSVTATNVQLNPEFGRLQASPAPNQ
jgi:hypothetical protein